MEDLLGSLLGTFGPGGWLFLKHGAVRQRLEKRSKELREKVKGKLGVAMPDDLDEDEEEKNE